MASEYDVTMKQYNGTDYDVLYPKEKSQQVLLNDNTVAQQIGITLPNPTVLDAISKLQTNINFTYSAGTLFEIVSYVGDGTLDATKSITFNLIPKIVLWIGAISSTDEALPMITQRGQIIMYSDMLDTNGVRNAGFQRITDASSYQQWLGWKSANGKTFYWRTGNGADENLNTTGTTYYFMGIGKGSDNI